jgi:hypothetical protein
MVGIQLPEKYKENFDVSSEASSSILMDDSRYRRNFDLDKKNANITIAGTSILK